MENRDIKPTGQTEQCQPRKAYQPKQANPQHNGMSMKQLKEHPGPAQTRQWHNKREKKKEWETSLKRLKQYPSPAQTHQRQNKRAQKRERKTANTNNKYTPHKAGGRISNRPTNISNTQQKDEGDIS